MWEVTDVDGADGTDDRAQPEQDGFDPEQINSSDNLARVPTPVGRAKTARYGRLIPGRTETVREALRGVSWDDQYQLGVDTLNQEFARYRRDPVDESRDAIRSLLLDAEARIRISASAEESNAATEYAVAIADYWEREGRLLELLTPLTEEQEPDQVRFGAASLLLHRGHAEMALPVLAALEAIEAKALLMIWERDRRRGDKPWTG